MDGTGVEQLARGPYGPVVEGVAARPIHFVRGGTLEDETAPQPSIIPAADPTEPRGPVATIDDEEHDPFAEEEEIARALHGP